MAHRFLSDEQYLDRIRWLLRMRRRVGVALLLFGIGFGGSMWFLGSREATRAENSAILTAKTASAERLQETELHSQFLDGFIIGGILALGAWSGLGLAVMGFGLLICRDRKGEMLLKCVDKLGQAP